MGEYAVTVIVAASNVWEAAYGVGESVQSQGGMEILQLSAQAVEWETADVD